MFQSTHPHGVRLTIAMVGLGCRLFQSTHPHGVRQKCKVCGQADGLFQSTHPHGVRPCPLVRRLDRSESFNPRTRTGCDQNRPKRVVGGRRFQSTHPHGVRRRLAKKEVTFMLFQSTHPHGVRQNETCEPHSARIVSIHAPARGATC